MDLQATIKDAVCWDIPAVTLRTNLLEVIELMTAHNTSALIVKDNGNIVGIVSDLDILESISAQGLKDEPMVSQFLSSCELISEESSTTPCVQLDEDESVENAIKLLSSSGTHNLVVTGSEDKHGILSLRNLLKLLASN